VLNTVWQLMAIVGSLLSLALLVFYWHPWLVFGAVLNAAFLVAIWQQWPAAIFSLK
jgi:predicted exporter